ncbi:hypothetical protein BY458DRAFT_526333 [Sporodiniella umbellata]|nr:hypothetical protein BY458DRAFT_526333 [Sporodiniella umbellata]
MIMYGRQAILQLAFISQLGSFYFHRISQCLGAFCTLSLLKRKLNERHVVLTLSTSRYHLVLYYCSGYSSSDIL